jgi:predicted aminopeptidase
MNSNEASLLAKLIPGFGSYASEQKRRDDDLAIRRYLIDRLQGTKKSLQSFALPFVEKGNFEVLKASEQLRTQLEHIQSKLRAATEGYSSWFDSNRVDEAKLKQVVDLDNDLVSFVDKLDSLIEKLDSGKPDLSEASAMSERIRERFARRKELLCRQ